MAAKSQANSDIVKLRQRLKLLKSVRKGSKLSRTEKELDSIITSLESILQELAPGKQSKTRKGRAMENSGEHLKNLLNATSDGFWERNPVTGEIKLSHNWLKILQYEFLELPVKESEFLELIHPDDRTQAVQAMKRHLSGESDLYVAEFRLRGKSGNWRWILSRGRISETDCDGNPLQLTGTHTDITEQKLAEEALRTSEERYRLLLDTIPHGVREVDLNGKIVFCNSAHAIASGYRPDELAGKNIADLFYPESEKERFKKAFQEMIRYQPKPEPYFTRVITKSGQLIDVQIDWNYLRDETGKLTGINCVVTDITEQIQSDLRLRLQRDVNLSLSTVTGLEELADKLLAAGMQLDSIDCGGFYLFDRENQDLHMISLTGFSQESREVIGYIGPDNKIAKAVRDGKLHYWNETTIKDGMLDNIPGPETFRAIISLPIIHNHQLVAILAFGSRVNPMIPEYIRETLEAITINSGAVIARVQAESASQENANRYRQLFNNVREGILLTKADEHLLSNKFVEVNESSCAMLGYSREELLNFTPNEIVTPEIDRGLLLKQVEIIRRKGESEFVTVLKTKQGKLLEVETKNRLFTLKGDQFVLSLVRDVTQRNQAQRALSLKARYEESLASCSEALLARGETKQALAAALKPLLKAVQVSRIRIFENYADAENRPCFRRFYEIRARGLKAGNAAQTLKKISCRPDLDRWKTLLSEGKLLAGSSRDFPEPERKMLKLMQTESLLAAPLMVLNEFFGFITFENVHGPASWTAAETSMIRTAAGMIGSFLERRKTEAEIRESSRYYREIFDSVSDAVLLTTYAGGNIGQSSFVEVNDAACKLTGYSREELLAMGPLGISDREHNRRRDQEIARNLRAKGQALTEVQLISRNGTKILSEIHARVTKLKGKEFVIATIRNITERRTFEQLLDLFEFQQKLIDILPIPIYYKNTRGDFIGCNKAMLHEFGTVREDFIGKTFRDVFGNRAQAAEIREQDRKLLREGGSSIMEMDLKTPAGNVRKVMIHTAVLYDEEHKPEYLVGAFIDLTELKKTEAALIDAEQKLNTILNTMHEIILRLDSGRRIIWANRAACRAFGNEDKIIGKKCHEVWFGLDTLCAECPAEHALQNFQMESAVIKHPNGQSYEIYSYPVIDAYGKSAGWVEVAQNITEQVQAQNEAKLRQEQLIQADKMTSLGILVSGVAHEINNPTNFIMINISILRKIFDQVMPLLTKVLSDDPEAEIAGIPAVRLDESIKDLYSGIEEGTDRISDIVNNLKDYARQSPSDMSGLVDMNQAVKNSLMLLNNLIRKSTEKCTVEYAGNLPPVRGDLHRLEQVIVNVLQNACHALENPRQAISIRTFYQKKRQMVVVEVKDEGGGISEENLRHLTDPFFTTKRDSGGTGLGLSVSSGIIKEHMGRLEFNSKLAKGTAVQIVLPVANQAGKPLIRLP